VLPAQKAARAGSQRWRCRGCVGREGWGGTDSKTGISVGCRSGGRTGPCRALLQRGRDRTSPPEHCHSGSVPRGAGTAHRAARYLHLCQLGLCQPPSAIGVEPDSLWHKLCTERRCHPCRWHRGHTRWSPHEAVALPAQPWGLPRGCAARRPPLTAATGAWWGGSPQ